MKLTHAFGVLLLVALVCAQTTPSDDGTSGSPDSDSCRAHDNGVMRNCEACAAFGEDESNTCNWCVSPHGAGACRSRAACQALSHEVGQCPSNTNPCESHTCDDNERCHVTASGAAACVHVCVGVSCNDDGGNTRVCLANNLTATGFECRPVCDPDYIDCGDDECRVEHAKAVCRDPCDNLCGSVTEAGIVASTCNRDTGVCQCSNDNTPVARTTTTTTADGESVTTTVLVCSDVVMTEDPCDDVHCDDNSRCTLSADGNARCTCNPGYTRSTINGRCVEIALDPCATALCAPNHRCVATPDGHPECICAPGYERRAGQCVEIVEPCGDDEVRNAFGVCVRECADGTAAIHGKCREDIVCHDGYIVSPHLDDGDYRCVFPCDALNTFVHHRCDCPIDCPAGEAYNRETCSCATNCADGTLVDADGLCDGCPLGTFPRVVTHTHVSSNEDGVNAATTVTISRTECWVRCPEDDDDDAPVFKPSPDECPRPDCSIDQVRDRGTDECVGTCPDGTRPYNGNCDDLCELSSYECCLLRGGQNCVRPCDAGQIRVGDACVTPCDNATITSVNGECGGEGECPDDRFLIDTACKVRCPNGDVVDALSDCCPAHSRLDIASGVCFCWNGKRATREGCDRPCESPRECCRSPLVWDATNAACTCSDGSDPRDRGCPDINQCRDNLAYNADVDACLCPNGENPNDEGRCRCNVETNPDCPITPHNCEGRDDLRKCRCRNPDNADEPECQDPVVLSVRICKKYPNRRGCFCLLHPNSDRCKRPRPCAFTSAGCECASDANRDDLHCWCKLEANRDSRRCACFRDSSLCSFDDDDVPNCHDADITDSGCACFFDSTNPSFQLANGEIRCDINATTEERDHIETEVRCRNSAGDGVNAECEKDLDVGMPETDGNTTRVSVTMRERTDDERAMMEEEMGRPYVREDDIEVEVSDSDDEPATFRFRRTTVIRDYMGEDQDDGTTATDFDVRIGRIAEVRRETDDGVPTAEDEIVAEWFARDDERTVHTNVNDDGTCVTHTVTTSSGVVTYVSDICSVDREIGGRIIPAEAMRLSCQIDFPREYDDSYVCMAIHVRAHADDQEVRDVDGEEAAVEVINPDNDDERMVVGRADFSSDAFIGIGGESSVRCSAAVRSADGTSLVKKCCFDTPSSTFFWDPEMTPGSADPNVGAYENPDDGGTGAPINNNDDPDNEGGLSGGAIGGIAGGAGFCCIAGLVIGAVMMARGNKGDKPAATKANVKPARKAERSMSSIDSSSASSSADPTTDSQGASASSSSSA